MFQFHSGSIKSFCVLATITPQDSFNSIVVRLKVWVEGIDKPFVN